MTKYRVMGMNSRASAGVGPTIIEAESIEEAKEKFAESEGTTIETMLDDSTHHPRSTFRT